MNVSCTASSASNGEPSMRYEYAVSSERCCSSCCSSHHRPAVASRVRLRPDGTQEVEYLCELALAEERLSRPFGGRSLFDDFFSDFFDQSPSGGAAAAPPRQIERVDVTQFFSDATRELLRRAAQNALEGGSLDLDTDNLLHA